LRDLPITFEGMIGNFYNKNYNFCPYLNKSDVIWDYDSETWTFPYYNKRSRVTDIVPFEDDYNPLSATLNTLGYKKPKKTKVSEDEDFMYSLLYYTANPH